MYVDIELKIIADRYGFLSPDLAVGYRAAVLAREQFDGLDDLYALTYCDNGASYALTQMLNKDMARPRVSRRDLGRSLFVFFHVPTQTVLRTELITRYFAPPLCIAAVEKTLRSGAPLDEYAIQRYRDYIDNVIHTILSQDVFAVKCFRCRRAYLGRTELHHFRPCDRCGADVRQNRLYDVEGFIVCPVCASVLPAWFDTEISRSRIPAHKESRIKPRLT